MRKAVPLTEAQSGLWYAQRLDPANPIFNTGQYLDLRGPLDVPALRTAMDLAGEEAEALSLRFIDAPEGPLQVVDRALQPRLEVIDLSGEADPEGAALAAIRKDMATPIMPESGPMARQVLYRLAADRHLWAQQVHHFAIDGYGMVLLTARIAELYGLILDGKHGGGRALGSLAGVWDEDAAYRASPDREADAAWWRAAMDGSEEVVGMAVGKATSAFTFHRFEQALPAETRETLIKRAKAASLVWPDVLTALVSAYIRRFTGTEEVTVGVPYMGRMGSASARVPAMVMNVLPLRVTPDEDGPLAEYLAQVASATAEARKHGRYRSEQLRRDLGLIGGNRRLYGPLVNVQPYDRPPRMAGLQVDLHVTGTGPVEDINFTFRGDALNALTVEVDANPNLYSADEVAAHWQ
jgi:enterobactin synthetase component F